MIPILIFNEHSTALAAVEAMKEHLGLEGEESWSPVVKDPYNDLWRVFDPAARGYDTTAINDFPGVGMFEKGSCECREFFINQEEK